MGKSEIKVVDRGFNDMVKRAQALAGGAVVHVGVLSDSEKGGLHQTLPNGKAAPLTVAEIAAVNEFGTKDGHIPSRPAFRGTFDRIREELSEMSAKLVVRLVVDGKVTADQALNLLGLKLASEIRATIVAGVSPPNAPSTLKAKLAKGTTKKKREDPAGVKPLIDTGRLLGAISWAIVRNGVRDAAKYVSGK